LAGEQAWNTARLIPTSGINGPVEQERRATSALLAVMSAVREFGRTLTAPLGAPAGRLETFIEVPFFAGDKKVFPDGLIQTHWGTKKWTALVEVKTGDNDLRAEQLEAYLDVARENGFDALITISNEIPPSPGQHPTAIDKHKLRKVVLRHWSWSEVLTHAIVQKEFHGVADPDQAWILGELIRYLEHPRSGALTFHDMGSSWATVREAVASGTLRKTDKGAREVANRFDALMNFACLSLGRQLGTQVSAVLTRSESVGPEARTNLLVESLCDRGKLAATLKIPNAVAPLAVEVDLRSSRITCHFDVLAPATGRQTTRVNWLLRQLRAAPDTARVEAYVARSRDGAAALLRDARADPGELIVSPTKDIVRFRVAQVSPVGTKRGLGRGSFIESVLGAIDQFYREIGQSLKAWTPSPPKLRGEEDVESDRSMDPSLVSTAISSEDGTQAVSAAKDRS
jgi:hypothetical protein